MKLENNIIKNITIISEKNKILWDSNTTYVNKLAYKLYLKSILDINVGLAKNGRLIRSAYMPISDFIKNKYLLKKWKDDVNIYLRKDKIEKIMNKNNE